MRSRGLPALLTWLCVSYAVPALAQYPSPYATRPDTTALPSSPVGSTLWLGRLNMLVTYTDLRCHYHLRPSRDLAFHRQVRCDHTHGRHPDVRYTGGL